MILEIVSILFGIFGISIRVASMLNALSPPAPV